MCVNKAKVIKAHLILHHNKMGLNDTKYKHDMVIPNFKLIYKNM